MEVSLRKKTFYTSLTKILNIFLNFSVQFIITPLILNGLGKQLFGVYTIINKMQGYLSMVDLRPTAILRYKLASLQTSKNLITKREYVGASIILSLFILPFMLFLGWIISLVFENIFEIEAKYAEVGKTAIMIVSAFVGIKGLLGVPEAIIRGNNLEYKAFFLEPIRLVIYALTVYLFLYLGFGLIGVIFAIISAALLDFILKSIIQRIYLPGYTPLYPAKNKLKEFLGNGSWYMLSSLFSQVLNTFDIIIIGIIFGINEVTIYALSKAMLFRISESLADVIGGMTASVGHLISNNQTDKIIELRERLLRSTLIMNVIIMSYFIIFNQSFVSLWVGESNYIGNNANIVLVFASLFNLLCLVDDIFINSLQIFNVKSKVLLGVSVFYILVTLLFSYLFGIIAIPLGLALAKLFQLVYYHFVLQRHFKLNFRKNLAKNYKLIILMIGVLIFQRLWGNFDIPTWSSLFVYSLIFGFIIFAVLFFVILLKDERKLIIEFIKKRV